MEIDLGEEGRKRTLQTEGLKHGGLRTTAAGNG